MYRLALLILLACGSKPPPPPICDDCGSPGMNEDFKRDRERYCHRMMTLFSEHCELGLDASGLADCRIGNDVIAAGLGDCIMRATCDEAKACAAAVKPAPGDAAGRAP